jgi:hypothetical protein
MTHIKKILSFFQKALSNFLEGIIQARQRQVEAYLARSVDLADLERRMKEVQKDGIGRPGF